MHQAHFLTLFAKQGADKVIKIWDASNGDILRTLKGHTQGISDVAWAPDGKYIASGSDDKSVKIWSLDEVRRPFQTF